STKWCASAAPSSLFRRFSVSSIWPSSFCTFQQEVRVEALHEVVRQCRTQLALQAILGLFYLAQ
ncbi:hypothetical protein C7E25_24955, partial [Stenotrophomonas maltophilia]